MGIGHLGASFALRTRFRRVPLFFLLVAGVLVDLFWGITILSGVEHARIEEGVSFVPIVLEDVRYTHSLVACLVWSALTAAAWWFWRRDRAGAIALGALVLSHWVLDVVSHVADIPLLPAGPLLGLGLWRWRAASAVVELGLFGAGLGLYVHGTSARDRFGSVGLFAYAVVLAVMGLGAFFGPPPPSVVPIAAFNVVLLLPLLFIDRVDRHRKVGQAEPLHTP
jgi:hypothetical protein